MNKTGKIVLAVTGIAALIGGIALSGKKKKKKTTQVIKPIVIQPASQHTVGQPKKKERKGLKFLSTLLDVASTVVSAKTGISTKSPAASLKGDETIILRREEE
jgi:ribosome-binding protein aMBF1 (putative translation factor)